MKKKFFLLLIAGLALCKYSHATITDEGVTREKTVSIFYSTTVANQTGAQSPSRVCLIQLSSTSWPHLYGGSQDVGEVDLSHIHVDIDKAAASSGTVRLGVITYVNTSTGTVTWFFKKSYTKNVSNTNVSDPENETPSFYRCRVVPISGSTVTASTPYILSNEFSTGNIYTSTGAFPTPGVILSTVTWAPIPPLTSYLRAGDILMEISNLDSSNSVVINAHLLYHTEK